MIKMSPTAETNSCSANIRKTFSAQQLGSGDKFHDVSRSSSFSRGNVGRRMNGLIDVNTKYSRCDFFQKEPCLYSHQVFLKAAKIFASLRHATKEEREQPYLFKNQKDDETSKVDDTLEYTDETEKRLTFELAFETLKYQGLYDQILFDCAFFAHFPRLRNDYGLVLVVLSDYQRRKFQLRNPLPGEQLDEYVQSVEDDILELKVKLNACLARHRIKHCALSVEWLLPENVRAKDAVSSKLPVYLWVNQFKTSVAEIISRFKDEGFHYAANGIVSDANKFCTDRHCEDVIMFSHEARERMMRHELLHQGLVGMQDKSSCLAPNSVKHLVNDGDEVLHINIGSGLSAIHLGSVLKQLHCSVMAIGPNTTSQFSEIQKKINLYEANNVQLVKESFLDINPDDTRLKSIKLIMISAECSKSGVTSPVDFIVTEGEDMSILKDLSIGEVNISKLGQFSANHSKLLKHAMSFPKVHAVVYSTKSIYDVENDTAVQKSIEHINLAGRRRLPFRVVPPVLPFSTDDIEQKYGISGKFIKFKPSADMHGCFVSVITREPEDSNPKDVIARATAKGLMKKKEKLVDDFDDMDDDLLEDSAGKKLLRKRSRKSPRKLKPAQSVPTYQKPSSSSVQSYIQHGLKKQSKSATATAISQRLSRPKLDNVTSKFDKIRTAEHMKVVKHPAPFR